MLSSEQFVRLWLKAYREGHPQKWVASEAGVTVQAVSNRAKRFTLAGVRLPVLAWHNSAAAIDKLNKIIEGDGQ